MDIKSNLLLCKPIDFYGICTIYPIRIDEYLNDTEKANQLYTPYIISKDSLNEDINKELEKYSIFEIILADQEYRQVFGESLSVFCKTDNMKIINNDNNEPELYFDDNEKPLNKHNFDEFADIIRLSGMREKFKPKQIPTFETPEGYERWKKYEEMQQKYQKKEEDTISNFINVVQNGGNFYIGEEVIKDWSFWKLVNTYNSIISRDAYDKQYSQYLVTGDCKGIKEHWSELLKVK